MGGWIDQILNNKICSRPTLGSSKQAASKPLTVHTEQLVVLLADWPRSNVAQAFNRRARLRPLSSCAHVCMITSELSSVKECQMLSRVSSFAKFRPRKKRCIVSAVMAADVVPRGRDAAVVSMILALRLPTVVGYPYLSQM